MLNEPIQPFKVEPRTLRCSITSGELAGGSRPAPQDLDTIGGKSAVAAVLAAAYFAVQLRPLLAGVTVLLLVAAVLYRLDTRRRQIAAAPILLASIMLSRDIVTCGVDYARFGRISTPPGILLDGTLAWLPLFLTACIFYAPKFPTSTGKILMVAAFLLLGSGLIPGRGFVAIFTMAQYLLFPAIGIGFTIDLSANASRLASPAVSVRKSEL
jgi:hypothetical protein